MVERTEDGPVNLTFSHPLHIHTLTHICPHTLTQAWKKKHVTVPLGPDGFAGFSVVGGRGPNFLTLGHSSLPR